MNSTQQRDADAADARQRWQRALESALETLPGAAAELARLLQGADIAALSGALEQLTPALRYALWQQMTPVQRGPALANVHRDVRRQLIARTDPDTLAQAAAPLALDALSDIDADLPAPVLERVLAAMDAARRHRYEQLRGHADDSAGGLMDADPLTVGPGDTLAQAAQALRGHHALQGKLPEHLHALMVVADDGRYLGSVELSALLVHDAARSVREVMVEDQDPIAVDLPARQVARRFADRDLLSAAVVDSDGRLVGRITVDDVVDVIRAEAERSQLANTGLDADTDTFAPALQASRGRALWLGINLVNALVAAAVIGHFEHTIGGLVALAVLMPVVASMGGVAGTQSLGLVIRAGALDQLHAGTRWRLLRRELAVGCINGVLWAAVAAGVAGLWFGSAGLAAVFAAAVVLNLVLGVAAGTLIPMALDRAGVDPALAGGVVLVALTDAVGFAIFLGLAQALLT